MSRQIFSPKSAVWALDFGPHAVIALAARQNPSGDWDILGEGRARPQGVASGEITRLSDAAEAVTEAIRSAEDRSGVLCRKLYFNFDDSLMQSKHPCGSKTLSGDGQISREDVRDASRSASRLIGDFESTPVYTRESGYLIDGKDLVADPLGVFGHQLDVTLHVVLARAKRVEQWKNIMQRAQIPQYSAVLSLDSVCQAVLENAALPRMVWDLGDDFVSGGVSERGILREYESFNPPSARETAERVTSVSRQWATRYGLELSAVVTGDSAGKNSMIEKFKETGLTVNVASPKGPGNFTEPAHAAIAGLLKAACQRERGKASVKSGGIWAGRVRDKASAFIQEYF